MSEFVTIARTGEVPPGRSKAIDLEGLRIALFNVEGRYYAIDDTCPHAGGSLSEGDVDGTTVECPLHSARFDLGTGQLLSPPADSGVTAYQVRVEGDEITIEIA